MKKRTIQEKHYYHLKLRYNPLEQDNMYKVIKILKGVAICRSQASLRACAFAGQAKHCKYCKQPNDTHYTCMYEGFLGAEVPIIKAELLGDNE